MNMPQEEHVAIRGRVGEFAIQIHNEHAHYDNALLVVIISLLGIASWLAVNHSNINAEYFHELFLEEAKLAARAGLEQLEQKTDLN